MIPTELELELELELEGIVYSTRYVVCSMQYAVCSVQYTVYMQSIYMYSESDSASESESRLGIRELGSKQTFVHSAPHRTTKMKGGMLYAYVHTYSENGFLFSLTRYRLINVQNRSLYSLNPERISSRYPLVVVPNTFCRDIIYWDTIDQSTYINDVVLSTVRNTSNTQW